MMFYKCTLKVDGQEVYYTKVRSGCICHRRRNVERLSKIDQLKAKPHSIFFSCAFFKQQLFFYQRKTYLRVIEFSRCRSAASCLNSICFASSVFFKWQLFNSPYISLFFKAYSSVCYLGRTKQVKIERKSKSMQILAFAFSIAIVKQL